MQASCKPKGKNPLITEEHNKKSQTVLIPKDIKNMKNDGIRNKEQQIYKTTTEQYTKE